ncbi:MAG TPA: DUF4129 domain-containing protein [Cellulomonas sp.]
MRTAGPSGLRASSLALGPVLALGALVGAVRFGATRSGAAPFGAARSEVPVVPDADQARSWLQRELAEPVYHQRPSLLQRFLTWLGDLFDGMQGLPISGTTALLVVVGVLVVVTLVAFWIAGPVRRSRRARGAAGGVLDGDDGRSAAELRAAADAAATRGDWSGAVADRFRAVVRSLEERAVLDERPGVTAHEAVEAAGARLPEVVGDLRRAGRLFDDVVYGDVVAQERDDVVLREVDTHVAAARPTAVTVGAGSGWATPGGAL